MSFKKRTSNRRVTEPRKCNNSVNNLNNGKGAKRGNEYEGQDSCQKNTESDAEINDVTQQNASLEKGSSNKSTTREASISDVSENEYVDKDVNCKRNIVSEDKDTVNENSDNKENDNKDVNIGIKTFASIVKKPNIMEENKLKFIPTVMNEDGNEVVIFDEELVNIGSQKWKLSLCGYLVGYKMILPELRYHLRRMWGKYGVEDIVDNGQGNWIFKFRNEVGLKEVLRLGPWMVNGRPLIVKKWNPEVGFEKVDHDKLPVWVKLLNIPMEAWTVDGLSAITSSLGRPITMDNMSAHVCKSGVGRTEYARVLVEMDAKKNFKDQVELQYRDKENQVLGVKRVNVEYEWKPDVCTHCKVFGHEYGVCNKRERTEEEQRKLEEDKKKENAKWAGDYDKQKEWNIVRNKRWKENSFRANKWMPKQTQSVRNEEKENTNKVNSKQKIYEEEYPALNAKSKKCGPSSSTNSFAALENEEKVDGLQVQERKVVDEVIKRKARPTDSDLKEWSHEMVLYYVKKWKELYGHDIPPNT